MTDSTIPLSWHAFWYWNLLTLRRLPFAIAEWPCQSTTRLLVLTLDGRLAGISRKLPAPIGGQHQLSEYLTRRAVNGERRSLIQPILGLKLPSLHTPKGLMLISQLASLPSHQEC